MTLKKGDVVYRYIYGVVKHYGVVVQEATFLSEAVIRTVHSDKIAPINQRESEFADGKRISVISYPGQLPRGVVVQRALSVSRFDYNLIRNNCENFYKQAHGLPNISAQAVVGCSLLALALVAVTKRSPVALLSA